MPNTETPRAATPVQHEKEEASLIRTPTKCILLKPNGTPCGRIFEANLLHDAAVLGENPMARLKQVKALMSPLMNHLEREHPEHALQSALAGETFASYLMMTAFEIDQATREKMQSDYTRWKIRQMMTRQESRISDDRIEARLTAVLDTWAKGFENREQLHDELYAVMKHLRDVLEEKDRYPTADTQIEQPAQVAT